MINEDVLTPFDAAEFLHISVDSLRRLCREQRIAYIKIDRTHWLFTREDLLEFLERQKIEASRPMKKLDQRPNARLDSLKRVVEITEIEPTALRKELNELCR